MHKDQTISEILQRMINEQQINNICFLSQQTAETKIQSHDPTVVVVIPDTTDLYKMMKRIHRNCLSLIFNANAKVISWRVLLQHLSSVPPNTTYNSKHCIPAQSHFNSIFDEFFNVFSPMIIDQPAIGMFDVLEQGANKGYEINRLNQSMLCSKYPQAREFIKEFMRGPLQHIKRMQQRQESSAHNDDDIDDDENTQEDEDSNEDDDSNEDEDNNEDDDSNEDEDSNEDSDDSYSDDLPEDHDDLKSNDSDVNICQDIKENCDGDAYDMNQNNEGSEGHSYEMNNENHASEGQTDIINNNNDESEGQSNDINDNNDGSEGQADDMQNNREFRSLFAFLQHIRATKTAEFKKQTVKILQPKCKQFRLRQKLKWKGYVKKDVMIAALVDEYERIARIRWAREASYF